MLKVPTKGQLTLTPFLFLIQQLFANVVLRLLERIRTCHGWLQHHICTHLSPLLFPSSSHAQNFLFPIIHCSLHEKIGTPELLQETNKQPISQHPRKEHGLFVVLTLQKRSRRSPSKLQSQENPWILGPLKWITPATILRLF